MEDITALLVAWRQGDKDALNQLMPLVYDRLCALAASFLKREREDHTLQTTALVHEAYFRLVQQDQATWRDRAHFFAIAAQMMRRILVDHARRRCYAKRGGGAEHIAIEGLDLPTVSRAPDLLALDDALRTLAAKDEQLVHIVELRYFGGLSKEEIAEVLGISRATVTRRWRLAKTWLFRQLVRGDPGLL